MRPTVTTGQVRVGMTSRKGIIAPSILGKPEGPRRWTSLPHPFPCMLCQNCGTEIADKAIVCFRCGQATVAPLRKPARRHPMAQRCALLALVLLALATLFLGRAGTIDVPNEVRYGVIAVAVALLGWRLVARRR